MSALVDAFRYRHRFSPIVYFGAERNGVTIRLADNTCWRLTAKQVRECGPLNFRHVAKEKVDV